MGEIETKGKFSNWKILYETGETAYEGEVLWKFYNSDWAAGLSVFPCGKGKEYYKNGAVMTEGTYNHFLIRGKEYYRNGQLRFKGRFFDKYGGEGGEYYGPLYPLTGKYYDENGCLLYDGKFEIKREGSLGWPKVTVPEGYHYLDTDGDTYHSLLIKSINMTFDQYRKQCIQEIKSYLEDYNSEVVTDYISKSEDSILKSYQDALRDYKLFGKRIYPYDFGWMVHMTCPY